MAEMRAWQQEAFEAKLVATLRPFLLADVEAGRREARRLADSRPRPYDAYHYNTVYVDELASVRPDPTAMALAEAFSLPAGSAPSSRAAARARKFAHRDAAVRPLFR